MRAYIELNYYLSDFDEVAADDVDCLFFSLMITGAALEVGVEEASFDFGGGGGAVVGMGTSASFGTDDGGGSGGGTFFLR